MQLSKYFNLSDLTVTNTGIYNEPDSGALNNLKNLASLLDDIRDKVGPFTIASAYRTEEVNDAVGGATNSLHKTGKAVDLIPSSDSPSGFYKKLIQKIPLEKMGEITNKEEQGSLHVTLPAPEVGKVGTLMYRQGGSYFSYTAEQIKQLMGSAATYTKENPIMIVSTIAVLSIIFFLTIKKVRV